MNNKKFSCGITLIELLTVIVVLAIIAVVCIPSFHSIFAEAESKKISSTLRTIIHDSKQNAYIHRQRVAMCGSHDGHSCSTQAWSNGLLIFNDSTPNRNRDPNEQVINYIRYDLKYGQLQWRGFGVSGNILFHPDTGLPRGSNGYFIYCALNQDHHKKIILSKMGHSHIEKITSC